MFCRTETNINRTETCIVEKKLGTHGTVLVYHMSQSRKNTVPLRTGPRESEIVLTMVTGDRFTVYTEREAARSLHYMYMLAAQVCPVACCETRLTNVTHSDD